MKKQILLLFMLSCLMFSIKAQQRLVSMYDTSKTVTVSGEAELIFDPDYYLVEIEINDGFCKKGESIETLLEKVKSILKDHKISSDSLKLKSLRKENSVLAVGTNDMVETRKYQIALYSKDSFDNVFTALQGTQMISCALKDVGNSKLESYKATLYENAIKDARRKADAITKATAQKIEMVLKVQEEKYYSNNDELKPRNNLYGFSDEINYRLSLTVNVVFKVN